MNGHENEPADLNFEEFGFIYADYPYFDWFRRRTEPALRAVWIWKDLHRGATYLRDEGIALRDRGIPLSHIWNGQELVVGGFAGLPLITCAFLHHLHEPEKFPIFDKYVWLAMRQMRPDWRLPKAPDWDWERHYRRYICFFNDFFEKCKIVGVPQIADVDDAIVRRRVLDRALWTYGKFHDCP
jgi:hypothetical protein